MDDFDLDKKFTFLDTPTQIISLILLFVGGYVVLGVLLSMLFDFRTGSVCCSLFILVFVIILAILILLLIKNQDLSEKVEKYEEPIEILNKRYAKGEISREEYEQMKNDIKNKN